MKYCVGVRIVLVVVLLWFCSACGEDESASVRPPVEDMGGVQDFQDDRSASDDLEEEPDLMDEPEMDAFEPDAVLEATLERGGGLIAGAHGIAMSDDGTLFVADTFANHGLTSRLYRLSSPYMGPWEVVEVDAEQVAGLLWNEGRFYICDLSGGRVFVMDSGLLVEQIIETPSPWNLVGGAEGALWTVSYLGSVEEIGSGRSVTLFSGLEAPFDLVKDPDEDAIWVSEQISEREDGRVSLRSFAGEILRTLEHAWSNPEGLAIDKHGTLWVAETGAGELLRFDRENGELLQRLDVNGLPILLVPEPGTGNLLVGVTGTDPSWQRIVIP